MTARAVAPAVLLLAAAVLSWPARRPVVRLPPIRRSASCTDAVPLPATAAVLAALAGAALSTPVVAGLAAAGAAAAVLGRRRRGRARVEEERVAGLTEALGALAAELRSGRPLEDAAAAAGAACGDGAVAEALLRAVRAPASFPAPDRDAGAWDAAVARVAAAARLSVRTGCSLSAVVGAVEDDLRARRRHRLELRSALAGPRASAALLAGLPVLALLMGGGIGADPWRVLTTTGTGQVLLVLGVALEAAGLAWTARLVARVTP
ncbi:type II secretion system F family protein [Blastococcus sp. TF02A-26]|uniref:type II secretion system F family protein n=1 Tax=Blastococcus sp. TF02A-26 TaxID=2250577 RepID=UPI000DEA22C8|nr:type II secretion system F family protein [Blastococcus sp. TF02A-26]RBY84217.1 pilus assembly protein TadB [Blastococcus sp. TF02A-26]